MSIIEAIVLGIVQGLTEFIPVSSSAHLVLVPWWLGWDPPPLSFDTFLHLGTLLAVVTYFWRDWWDLAQAVIDRLRGRGDDAKWRLAVAIVVGTIPAAIIGYLFESYFEAMFGEPALVAAMLLVTGVILIFAEAWKRGGLPLASIRLSDAALIGLAQAVAIVPGISRSGATIATGLLRGLDRPAAARYSFLLSAPIIFGAGIFQLKSLAEGGIDSIGVTPLIVGFIAAALSGFLAIRFLMRYLQTRSLYLFAGYVWVFGTLSLLRAFL